MDMDVGVGGSTADLHLAADTGSLAKNEAVTVAIDLIAGSISGCAGIVVGQPFDTVKVRLQTQDVGSSKGGSFPWKSAGAITCASEIISKEGLTALFKGMASPLATAAVVNAITFSTYAESMRVMESQGFLEKWGESSRDAMRAFIGGSFAGFCQSAVLLPTDNVKVKLQVQQGAIGSTALMYKGPMDCATQMIRTWGFRPLFQGGVATLWRDVPSFGMYFSFYVGTKGWFERRCELGSLGSSMVAGGLAGALSWFFVYPFDVVKTVQQASGYPLSSETRNMSACFRALYNSAGGGLHGYHRLFRGCATTVLRAVPVNAVIFPTYEWSVKLLERGLGA